MYVGTGTMRTGGQTNLRREDTLDTLEQFDAMKQSSAQCFPARPHQRK
jgi:hypothetical protein